MSESSIYSEKWREKNPNYAKEYYLKNRTHLIQKRKNYYRKHKKEFKIYQRRYLEKRYYQIHKRILHNLKINGCAICGYNKYDGALDFHHINPKDKKFHINASTMSRKDDSIIKELQKCMLLCANCHREKEGEGKRI